MPVCSHHCITTVLTSLHHRCAHIIALIVAPRHHCAPRTSSPPAAAAAAAAAGSGSGCRVVKFQRVNSLTIFVESNQVPAFFLSFPSLPVPLNVLLLHLLHLLGFRLPGRPGGEQPRLLACLPFPACLAAACRSLPGCCCLTFPAWLLLPAAPGPGSGPLLSGGGPGHTRVGPHPHPHFKSLSPARPPFFPQPLSVPSATHPPHSTLRASMLAVQGDEETTVIQKLAVYGSSGDKFNVAEIKVGHPMYPKSGAMQAWGQGLAAGEREAGICPQMWAQKRRPRLFEVQLGGGRGTRASACMHVGPCRVPRRMLYPLPP